MSSCPAILKMQYCPKSKNKMMVDEDWSPWNPLCKHQYISFQLCDITLNDTHKTTKSDRNKKTNIPKIKSITNIWNQIAKVHFRYMNVNECIIHKKECESHIFREQSKVLFTSVSLYNRNVSQGTIILLSFPSWDIWDLLFLRLVCLVSNFKCQICTQKNWYFTLDPSKRTKYFNTLSIEHAISEDRMYACVSKVWLVQSTFLVQKK